MFSLQQTVPNWIGGGGADCYVICVFQFILYCLKNRLAAEKCKTNHLLAYHICTTILFFSTTTGDGMVADGLVGSGFSYAGFPMAWLWSETFLVCCEIPHGIHLSLG